LEKNKDFYYFHGNDKNDLWIIAELKLTKLILENNND